MTILNMYFKIPDRNSCLEDKMKIPGKGAAKTYKSLLAAASEVFAEKGYRDSTIAEICERARANVAAVNYHFGDKATLYREAWRHSFLESVKAHPPEGGVSDTAPSEERLRGQVAALLRRIADENNKEFLFVQKELANPTGLLDEVTQEELRPLHEKMETLVRELLGPRSSDMQVRFCAIGIISQCINPMVAIKGRKGNRENKGFPPGVDDIEAYSNHVVKFSLAGIHAIRDEAEKKRRGFKRQRRNRNAFKKE
jgi:AcrR family transcriptional regulator